MANLLKSLIRVRLKRGGRRQSSQVFFSTERTNVERFFDMKMR